MKKQYLMIMQSLVGVAPITIKGDMAELILAHMRSDAAGHTHFCNRI